MGTKNRKNSNYVTDKTIQAKAEKERAEKRKKQTKMITIITAAVLSVALLVSAVVVLGKYAFGWWDDGYEPTVTHHANITVEGYGVLHVELYGEEAPETVKNFVALADGGFYNGLTFDALMVNPNNEESVFIQGGDENTHGIDLIKGEYSENGVDNRVSHTVGTLSAPKSGMSTIPTKFFIMASSDYTDMFDGFYAAFGKVTSGLDILEKICEESQKNITAYDEKNLGDIHPKKQVKITSIVIHEAH